MEKEKLTEQPYPDLLAHESNGEPPFIEYTENEWNNVLTHQPLHPTSPPLAATNPIIPPSDRVSSTQPKLMTYSSEVFRKAVGFRNIQSILQQLTSVSQNTLHVNNLGRDPVRDQGEMATMPKSNRNTNLIAKPSTFGE
eukprot:11286050-Ditylum_brightwellii.AAC.2